MILTWTLASLRGTRVSLRRWSLASGWCLPDSDAVVREVVASGHLGFGLGWTLYPILSATALDSTLRLSPVTLASHPPCECHDVAAMLLCVRMAGLDTAWMCVSAGM